MYSSASSSMYSNPLVDIFLPKYCQKDLEKMVNPSQVSTAVSPNSISQHLCNHSSTCKICSSVKPAKVDEIAEKVEWHKKVRDSGKYNVEGCKIRVNYKINTDYMRQMLRDYKDIRVCDLLEFGFPLGFKGDENLLPSHDQIWKYRNHKGATDFAEHMIAYLEKENRNQAVLGPFKSNPFPNNLVISPLNSVPKKDNERRVILDLSYPRNSSINDFIEKDEYLGEKTEIIFPKVDDFVELIKQKGRGCLLFKKDLRRAYRQISIDPGDYSLVAFIWGKHIFCDTVLSMGLKSSAAICQRVTNAISFIMFQIGIAILNYLDDLAGAEKKEHANFAYLCLGTVLQRCGIEEAPDKACSPTEVMIFLGVLFNTITMTVEVTKERLAEIRKLTEEWLNKDLATIKQIQSLLGKLNFVGACVKPSRIFISRMLNWLRSIYHSPVFQHAIPELVRKDLLWWNRFLPLYNGVSMMEYENWSEPDAIFSSDSCLTACGGFWNGKFFHVRFPEFILGRKLHISALEILAVILCLKLWGKEFIGKRIVIYCDNQAVCQVINSGKTRCEFLQQSLREICFLAAINQFEIRAQFLEGSANRLADVLSRWHLDRSNEHIFMELTEGFTLQEYFVPVEFFEFVNLW